VAKLREQGWEYALEAAYIEVYNEQLRDLLADTAPGRREAGKIQGACPAAGVELGSRQLEGSCRLAFMVLMPGLLGVL